MSQENKETVLKTEFTSGIDDLLANPFGEQELIPAQQPSSQSLQNPLDLLIPFLRKAKQRALELSKQIDPANHQAIIAYGTQAQSQLLSFSSSMLDHVQNKDIGPIGDILSELMSKLKDVNPDELSLRKRIFSQNVWKTFKFYSGSDVQVSKDWSAN